MKRAVLVKVFAEIVDEVNANLQAIDSTFPTVRYDYGHITEIGKRLQDMTFDPVQSAKKFPLIVLVTDFEKNHTGENYDVSDEVKLRFLILYWTDPTYTAQQRTTNTFEPYLLPIELEFLNQICLSGKFAECNIEKLRYNDTDRYFWGRESKDGGSAKNIFGDYLDAIEIENLELSIYFENC